MASRGSDHRVRFGRPRWLLGLPLLAVVGLLLTAAPLFAAPPSAPDNDRWKNAEPVEAPDIAHVNPNGATLKGGEKQPSCNGTSHTVWYSLSTDNVSGTVDLNTFGSDYDTVLAVWIRSGGWTEIDCNDDAGGGLQSDLTLAFDANTTYYIQIGKCCSKDAEFDPGENELDFTVGTPVPN